MTNAQIKELAQAEDFAGIESGINDALDGKDVASYHGDSPLTPRIKRIIEAMRAEKLFFELTPGSFKPVTVKTL